MYSHLEKRTNAQNRMIHALVGDITRQFYNDFEKDRKTTFQNDAKQVKKTLKLGFANEFNLKKNFSTSNLTKDLATEFISYIIEFCFQFDVPIKRANINLTAEINRFLFLCIKYRKCCVTGTGGEIHHIDAIGMGRDRSKYDHTQSRLICLSRIKHAEAHQLGWERFKEKYHVDGIRLSEKAVKEFNI